ncbi:B12-binding domain-containing radical SAM protein [Candidatus Magnetominusculus dajiuhuensis]|uniref:B12-binding domain-containing radical SAM protein n=1 Tax=Candidatus Magnetominusculus dajiuhuensis TaxID=3137712 RepID=UPI003B43B134
MKISLVSPYSSLYNAGLRSISAVLKNAGFDTRMIFLPMPSTESGWNISPFCHISYPESLLERLRVMTADSSIIGITLMDNYMRAGAELSKALKRADNFVIFGGVFPTLNPLKALEFADAACIGDGEYAMLELVRQIEAGSAPSAIKNIYFRGQGYPELDSIHDISSLPLPDYGPEGHYVYVEHLDEIIPMRSFEDYKPFMAFRPETNRDNTVYIYRMETARGCPDNCTYCANNVLKKVQSPKVRFKSIEKIEEEILWVKEHFPFVNELSIEDDSFFARKDVWETANLLKKYGLPFKSLFTPVYFTEELTAHLIACGMIACQIGLQSRAPNMETIYRRVAINKNIDEVLKFFSLRHPNYPLIIDLIVDNPWETPEDTLFTINYLLDHMPRNAMIGVSSLVFYNGTALCNKAVEENLLDTSTDYQLKTWHWHRQNRIHYTTMLLVMLKLRLPRGLIRALASKPVVSLLEKKFVTDKLIPCAVRTIKRLYKKIKGRIADKY